MASAAALPCGSGGCTLAISNLLEFATERETASSRKVESDHVSLLVAESRIFFVRIAAPQSQALSMNIHGPDASFKKERVDAFWDRILT